ncbi:MAG: hypothetical protein N2644_03585 [Candidatus Sumerlaea chitinivorans]|nr:hypothetical protein [Candidatus Sumerlaea chitinivorans]
MHEFSPLTDVLPALLENLFATYDERVTECGPFPDHSVSARVAIEGMLGVRNVRLEISVRSMNKEINEAFQTQRFLAVRLHKTDGPGFVSATCYHGTKEELRSRLVALIANPADLTERIEELAHGLPEETDPDLWR